MFRVKTWHRVPTAAFLTYIQEAIVRPNTELEEYSSVVETIYDAAVDRTIWPEALLNLRRFVGASSASLLLSTDKKFESTLPNFIFLSGYTEAFIQSLTAEYWQMWSLQANVFAWKVGEVYHLPGLMPTNEFLSSRFFREVLQPHQQFDYLGMLALREGPHSIHLNMSTTIQDGPLLPRNIALMRLLAPHICRSAKIGLALDLRTLRAETLQATLDSLTAAVYLTQGDGHIVFMNRSAEHQVKQGIGVKVTNNRLTAKNQTAAAALAASFAGVRKGAGQTSAGTVSVAIPDDRGSLIATVLQLGNGRRQLLSAGAQTDMFAVFMQDPAATPPIPGEAIANLYGLTPGELRVLLAIAQGRSSQEVADILGISLATVKTHFQHIYQKTGLNRQSDLRQMVTKASASITDDGD